MKKDFLFILLVLGLFFFGCGDRLKNDYNKKLQTISEELKIPEPIWDRPIEELVEEFKTKHNASDVRIEKQFYYRSKDDYRYWLSVYYLNPELGDKDFKEFGNEVAQNTLNHLTNDQDFEKIEIGVTQKKGFIITFSTSQNGFFYRDSLQAVPTAH